jgi:RNA polymerase sigma-70 factor (ECF subfamily)
MARLAEGDRSVFHEVFERLWGPTYRLCASLLKNDADAADAAQEAMAKILQRASDYDPTRAAVPWALAIAAWECRTLRRKLTRRREVPDLDSDQLAGEDSQEQLVERDLVQSALSAVGELSQTDRDTLMATFLDEAPPIAGATFRKRRERALGRLRDAWKRLYGLD